jgi:hypothetical protein
MGSSSLGRGTRKRPEVLTPFEHTRLHELLTCDPRISRPLTKRVLVVEVPGLPGEVKVKLNVSPGLRIATFVIRINTLPDKLETVRSVTAELPTLFTKPLSMTIPLLLGPLLHESSQKSAELVKAIGIILHVATNESRAPGPVWSTPEAVTIA